MFLDYDVVISIAVIKFSTSKLHYWHGGEHVDHRTCIYFIEMLLSLWKVTFLIESFDGLFFKREYKLYSEKERCTTALEEKYHNDVINMK